MLRFSHSNPGPYPSVQRARIITAERQSKPKFIQRAVEGFRSSAATPRNSPPVGAIHKSPATKLANSLGFMNDPYTLN
jgi:hypothetical protein